MRNVAKQGKIVNLIAFPLGGEGGRGPARGRMRGELAEVSRLWEIAAKPPLISRRAEPPTASPKRGKPL